MQPPRIEEYYAYSSEKPALLQELRRQVKPHYQSALDVGAGSGEVSQILAERTEDLHLCEPNPFYASTLQTRFPNAIFSFEPIETATLHRYDCILLSQSLYYHSQDQWLSLIARLWQHLRPKGEMYIVLNSDEGEWWDAVQGPWSLQPEGLKFSYIPSAKLVDKLKEKYDVERMTFDYGMSFPSQEAMESYVRKACVPLHDDAKAAEAAVATYIATWAPTKLTMDYKTDIIRLRR